MDEVAFVGFDDDDSDVFNVVFVVFLDFEFGFVEGTDFEEEVAYVTDSFHNEVEDSTVGDGFGILEKINKLGP